MKLPKSVQIKQSSKLFNNKHKYKIVLVTPGAGWFRGGNLENVTEQIALLSQINNHWNKRVKTEEEKEFILSLQKTLAKLSDYEIRVENPLISIYTNIEKNIELLSKVNPNNVKYVSVPAVDSLEVNKVVVKKLDYDYKLTLGRTKQDFNNFVEWCKNNKKIRLPERAKRDLGKTHSWGGAHFYVKDEKTLLMVKMFLSTHINKIEQTIKS